MITTGNLRRDLRGMIHEAMESDNQLALDLAYSVFVFRVPAEDEVFPGEPVSTSYMMQADWE